MRRYGFVAAGGGKYYSDFLRKLTPDDRLCAYQKQYGYVGFGIVHGSIHSCGQIPSEWKTNTDPNTRLSRHGS